MKIKNCIRILMLSFVILGVIALAVTMATYHNTDFGTFMESASITFLFFSVVGICFHYAGKRFAEMHIVAEDLRKATNSMKNNRANDDRYINKFIFDNEVLVFQNETLNRAYNDYMNEVDRINNTNADVICNIENYINHELILNVLKNDILNLISGTMTGLGILGTFIGLTLGLRNFNTGTSEEIHNSIVPLMDGIKIAFYTSIYGTVFSIVFSFIYKNILDEAMQAMDDFLETYEKCITGNIENDNHSTIQVLLKVLPQAIGNELSKCINESLVPQFASMNQSFKNFAQNMGETQIKGFQDIVEKFMEQMNTALNSDFEKLSKSIELTCQLQDENAKLMQEAFVNVNDIRQNMLQLNNIVQNTVETYETYISRVDNLQVRINESFSQYDVYLEKQATENKLMVRYAGQLSDYESKITESISIFAESMFSQFETLKSMQNELSKNASDYIVEFSQKAQEQNEVLADNLHQQYVYIVEETKGYSEEFNKVLQNQFVILHESAERLQQNTLENLQKMNDFYTGITSKMSEELSEHTKNYIQEMESGKMIFMNEVQKQVQDMSDMQQRIVNAIEEEIDKILEKFTNYSDELTQHIDALSNLEKKVAETSINYTKQMAITSEQYYTRITETAQSKINEIITLSNDTTQGLDNVSRELAKAAKLFNNELITSLERTFESFDSNLTEITTHLSGTISEVEKTTERVPHVVDASYEVMQESMKEIQKEIATMATILCNANEELNTKLNN